MPLRDSSWGRCAACPTEERKFALAEILSSTQTIKKRPFTIGVVLFIRFIFPHLLSITVLLMYGGWVKFFSHQAFSPIQAMTIMFSICAAPSVLEALCHPDKPVRQVGQYYHIVGVGGLQVDYLIHGRGGIQSSFAALSLSHCQDQTCLIPAWWLYFTCL